VLTSALQVAPGAFLGFGLLAVVAPLTAGGGQHVVPPDQLVAYPVRPSTHFLGGLLLAPVNLVWVLQLFVLVATTAWLSLDGGGLLPALTTTAFVVAVTVTGQALAWLVVGARQSRAGRVAVTAAWVVLGVVALAAVRTEGLDRVLVRGPSRLVVHAIVAGAAGHLSGWLPVTASLAALALVAVPLGAWACAWALRRPSDAHVLRHTATVRRRRGRPSVLRELIAVDRASVWRAPALRRGALVLGMLPGVLAAAAQVPWESLIVLPGLVAAGAGLLFGINAFALDGSGSLWLASLPVAPRVRLLSKAVVLTETVGGAVAVAALSAAVRSPGHPTSAQLTGIASSAVTCAAMVVAFCLSASLRRPHRADLRGPRDAIAPPGALTAASARLALPCALVAMLLAASSHARTAWLPPAVAAPFVVLAALSVVRTVRRWDDPVARARVVQVVAAG
jgi:hypothetical protein